VRYQVNQQQANPGNINMWKRLSNWLERVSSGWMTMAALLVFTLFSVLVLPGQSGSSAPDSQSPDLSFYYSASELYSMAEVYGPEGRSEYVQARFTFDLIWPLVYTFFLVTSLSWVSQRVIPDGRRWRLINLLPVWGMLCDYLENISTSIVMLRYPQATTVIDWLAGIFTLLKWLLISASFAGLLVGGLILVFRRVRRAAETS
jgi:hypothetical protein